MKIKQKKVKIRCEDGKEVEINASDILKLVNPLDLKPVDDMINLAELQERSILRNIYLRYLQNIIYTYTGGILISVNPYKQLEIYKEEDISNYQGKRLVELSPHIFAIGAQALSNLKRHLHNQCIVISGETGSGKTESTKLLLNFLAASSSKCDAIGKKIVEANPILEAFGNAKTTQNDNSSRFGKYIDIAFRHDGTMRSACIQHYLLEKARIKSQNIGDRNYHIFYMLLAGLQEESKDKLKLVRADNYHYLKQGKSLRCDTRDEKSEFLVLKESFVTLNFTEKEIWSIFQVLAAILHVGNFQYKTVSKGNDEETQILDCIHLQLATSLLSVKKTHFIEALTHKTIFVEGTKVVSELTIEQAIRNRDAFAMVLYNQLFSFILTGINKSISDHKVSKSYFSIGILDIFGFENFSSNSFEQLCINYANEHLQQFFVNHVFKLEQEEYKNEGIQWESLHYEDNEEVLNLMGLGKMSILVILDEQTKFPKGSDEGMLLKCNQNHLNNKYYAKAKSEVSHVFGIKHYAGTVTYKTEGFIEKNMNTLSLEWREVIRESESSFLKDLFMKELSNTGKGGTLTLASQYRQSLDSLMATLNSAMPFFIRCIKPNSRKEANVFDPALVCQQLRYSGMMETVKIRQIGYPIRYTYMQFILRYRILVPSSPPIKEIIDLKQTSKCICEKYLGKGEYTFGKTKIFLKIPDEKLERIRDQILTKSAICIQKNYRGSRLRNKFLKKQKAAVMIQKYWRGYKPHANFLIVQRGYLRLQAVLRSRQLTQRYSKIRMRIIRFQAVCRGFLKRKEFEKKKTVVHKPPVPLPRKSSYPETGIDSYIQDIFDNAVEGKVDTLSSDMKDYLKPSFIDDANEILKETDVMSFQKYAASNFMGNVNGKFTNKILDQPLLELASPGDQMAAPVIWLTILRFMGDFDENQSWTKNPIPRTRKSIMSQLHATLSKSFLHSKEFLDVLHALQEEEVKETQEKLKHGKSKLLNLTLIHRNKLQNEIQRAKMESELLKTSYQDWILGPPTCILDKLHFVIGHGILRPNLRDEIYCQLCKQLTDNSNQVSCMYGWILFSLCVTIFPPSPKLAPTILHFIASSGNMLGTFRKLQRTLENGCRSQPPSAFELSALKTQQKMFVEVFLLDDSTVTLEVDPATTAGEMIKAVCEKKNIENSFGYSIFLSMFGQVLSLEDRGRFLMDGISQFEMKAREKGLPEIVAPWNVIFRREIFSPCPLNANDAISIYLTYIQIIKGISLGEYRCSQECELTSIVAQHYYVLYGKNILPEILDSLIKEVVPEPLLHDKNKRINWPLMVSQAFEKSYFINLKTTEEDVKMNVVNFAKKKWPLFFSRYYEITQISGYHLGSSELLLAANSEGILICSNSVGVILKILYAEISSIEHVTGTTLDKDQLELITIRQQKYIFRSLHSQAISDYINSILDDLLFKSKYAVAIDDYAAPDENFLRLARGDLVLFNDISKDNKWMKGQHVSTGRIGEFPKKIVRILPCIEKPPLHILRYCLYGAKTLKDLTRGKVPGLIVKKHTLESYSNKYFRKDLYKNRGSRSDDLLKFTNNKLWSPLHRSLTPLTHLVTPMFTAILHYMGDRTEPRLPRYTRTIFEAPLQHEVLRDELYCLLIKQLTDNKNLESIKAGWELFVLATSLFPPSSLLIQDLEEWLDTRPCEMSCKCTEIMNTVLMTGPRKYPHHWLEVSSVQNGVPILIPVSFPNNMEQIFEVQSLTTVSELVEEVSKWLGLVSSEGFCLIVVFDDAAISLPPNEFLFDAILAACQFPATARGNETPVYKYGLTFVKKLWTNTFAGVDRTADLVCHYYQELPKYLAGSHNCTSADAMYLGALIFIAGQEDNKTNIDASNEILKSVQNLVPMTLFSGFSPQEWMYGIAREYEKNKETKSDDAKIMFLKVTQNWPNFGSAFFGVHTSSSMQDEQMTLVVNRNGVCLVHPHTQEIIMVYSYGEIIDCTFNDTSFTLKTTSRSFVWFTKTAHKVADLVTSYLDIFDTKYLVR